MAATDESIAYTVAFQGERGAYSEQAIYQLLGNVGIRPVPFESFDLAFAAISGRKVDLLLVPIENSLGGTIHANCDLQLQNSLFIIAEHDFRVRHSLLALPGTKEENITKVISHPQALAQCDSFIKRKGFKSEVAYDTAGSAKLISEGKLEGVAAICSDLAAGYYDLEVLESGIEDDSSNFTRFLLLRADPVRIPPGVKCKTSIVFSLSNQTGALFKALSAFSLRDIDLSKIESRPCKPDIMDRLERLFQSMSGSSRYEMKVQLPNSMEAKGESLANYRYLFYLDFLASIDDPGAVNAVSHLREISTFFRVLGSYPRGGSLVGLDVLGRTIALPLQTNSVRRRVGILGFGTFGQFIGKKLAADFEVFASSRDNYATAASAIGVTWCTDLDNLLLQRLDVLVISTSILSFEAMMRRVSGRIKELKLEKRLLVVDVLSVKVHAKNTMLALLPESCDILCTHPMFGPQSGKHSWNGLPFVFERVRSNDAPLCEEFIKWWGHQGCRMVDMSCELHDEVAAGSQFVTHFTGRVLAEMQLRNTPINTKGYDTLLQLVDNTCRDSFDLFFALYQCNPNSEGQLKAFEQAMTHVSSELRKRSSQSIGTPGSPRKMQKVA